MANIFKELSTLTLNRIAASVQYVFSMPVILQAGFNDQLQIETMRNKVMPSEVKHRHHNPVLSVDYAQVTRSITYNTTW